MQIVPSVCFTFPHLAWNTSCKLLPPTVSVKSFNSVNFANKMLEYQI